MTRFIHLTDLHLSHLGAADPHLNADTETALRLALARIAALRPAPEFVVLGGDLANHGAPETYALLRRMLDALPVPVVPAMGNHDDRTAFRAAFGWPGAADAPLFHHARLGGLHVIALDSSRPGRVSGALDAAQLAALRAALGAHPGIPKLIVCHHPPHPAQEGALAWESLDAESSARLAGALAGQAVVAMLCGHVHLNRLRIWQGLPVVTSIGLHATIDPLAPCEMVIEEGTGFALCDHGPEGLEVTFVPLTPERRVLKRIGHDVLRSFD